jgi:hypothetical protein
MSSGWKHIKAKPVFFAITMVGLFVATIAVILSNPLLPTKIESSPISPVPVEKSYSSMAPASETALATKNDCTVAGLQAQLTAQPFRSLTPPSALNFVMGAVQTLGGALFTNYLCETGAEVFTAQWVRAGEKWELKKISRPPERRPGDF